MPMSRREALDTLTAAGQPYELHEVEVRGRRVRAFRQAPGSLRALYAETATDQPFLVYEGERLSFAQAWARASAIAQVLVHECGVGKGDRVAISMRNYPEWVLCFCAATSIGAIAVAMNALWQADELAWALQDSGARVLFADAERLDRIAGMAPLAGLRVIGVRAPRRTPGADDLQALRERFAGMPMPPAEIDADDDATIFYTSGSTGHPKGVVSTHRAILSALLSWELDARAAALVAGVEPPVPAAQPATLLAVPLFHVTGSHAVYLMCYRQQRRMVCMYRWDAGQAAALIEAERISSFIAPAAMTGDLVRVGRSTRHDLGSLLQIGGGGAPRAPEQVRQIDATFAQALPATGWGMTETNAIGAGIGGDDYLQRPASSGRCSAVLELQVVDERGQALPPGQRGELRVRGTSLFRGYWNRPDLDAGLFDDGWFRTGDVATFDEDGFVYIVDRIKDLIIRGAENIGCGHVEAALLMHPQVHEAAVYAVPDERLGEEVGATIHADPALDLDALRAFLGERLARFEVPRFIVCSADPLPRTPSGKILKRELRAQALARLAGTAGPGEASA